MLSSLVRITDATIEPVTVDEAMAYLRVTDDEERQQVGRMIKSARQEIENYTGRALLEQTWKLTLSEWPDSDTIELWRSPLASVTHVKYYPESGAAQATLAADTYRVATGPNPGLIVLDDEESWPDLDVRPDAVEVTFVAGVADPDDVPADLVDALLLILAERYENRNRTITGTIVAQLPTVENILRSYRVGGFVA